jgi:predicted porin
MKKSLIALAALGAFAGAASAQSSVTLFGIVDVNARAVKNGDGSTVKSLTNNGLATSRLGFRGEEDLGGGLKANFWLEADVNPDVGTAGVTANSPVAATGTAKFFGRRSTVGLSGPFGEIRFGRDYVASYNNLSQFDAYGNVGIGNLLNVINNGNTQTTLGSGAGTLVRADNAIGYLLPSNLGGLYGQLTVAAGEGQSATAATGAATGATPGGTNGNNRHISGRVGFAAAGFDVAGAYGRTRVPGREDYKIWNVGASYNFAGYAKVMALYNRADFEGINQKTWSVGANVPLGAGEIRATYARVDLSGGTAVGLRNQDDVRLAAIGYVYNLSKRTALYTNLGRIQNRGGSALTIPGGTTDATFRAGGQNSTALDFGVRHSF